MLAHEKGGLLVYSASQISANEAGQSVEIKLVTSELRAGQFVSISLESAFRLGSPNTPAQE